MRIPGKKADVLHYALDDDTETQCGLTKADVFTIPVSQLTSLTGMTACPECYPATWAELFTADDNIANKYGIIQREKSVRIGDDSGTKTSLWND